MASEKRTFTGKEFIEHLRSRHTDAHVFTGIVKPAAGDPDVLMFARGMDCSRWVEIPVSMIERVEKLHTVVCGDHTHQLVHLFLNRPRSAEGRAFGALAQLHRSPAPSAGSPAANMPTATLASGAGIVCPPGTIPCWDWGRGQWTCCPVTS